MTAGRVRAHEAAEAAEAGRQERAERDRGHTAQVPTDPLRTTAGRNNYDEGEKHKDNRFNPAN
jgi:hypothetical protein